jgi:hypothetical protein
MEGYLKKTLHKFLKTQKWWQLTNLTKSTTWKRNLWKVNIWIKKTKNTWIDKTQSFVRCEFMMWRMDSQNLFVFTKIMTKEMFLETKHSSNAFMRPMKDLIHHCCQTICIFHTLISYFLTSLFKIASYSSKPYKLGTLIHTYT